MSNPNAYLYGYLCADVTFVGVQNLKRWRLYRSGPQCEPLIMVGHLILKHHMAPLQISKVPHSLQLVIESPPFRRNIDDQKQAAVPAICSPR